MRTTKFLLFALFLFVGIQTAHAEDSKQNETPQNEKQVSESNSNRETASQSSEETNLPAIASVPNLVKFD